MYRKEEEQERPSDDINHPFHYKTGDIEVYDVIVSKLTPGELRGFIKANVIRYVTREKYKGGDKDLRKAQWYLNRYLKDLESGRETNEDRYERRIKEHLFEDTGIQKTEESYMNACQECLLCAGVRL